jgi:hypothetical protein
MTEDTPGKHRTRETHTQDNWDGTPGGRHRAVGEEPAAPITQKRTPGQNMAKPLVRDSAARKYANRTKGIR